MYVVRRKTPLAGEELIEMTAKEFAAAQADDRQTLTQVRADEARRWVAKGGHHMTPLYVDMDGKVRRASE